MECQKLHFWQVYQATVMAKILYATSAWWRFTSASDRQRIEAFVGHAKKMQTLLC